MSDQPGWRYDPNSQRMRLWTGSAWTEQFGATPDSRPPPRGRNPYLLSMLIAGIVLVVFGMVWGAFAVRLLDSSSPLSAAYATAFRETIAAGSTASFGVTLLVIAWTVAAARWAGRSK